MTDKIVPPPQKFENHIGLVHLQTALGLRWANASGLRMEYDDLFQEASLAFIAAAKGFDPDAGVKFSAYYTKVAFSQFRQTIGRMTGVKNLNGKQREEIIERKAENKRRGALALPPLKDMNYGLRPVQFSEMTSQDGEFEPFEETLVSTAKTPEQALEFKQEWEAATSKLSPLALLIVSWLSDPPPELMTELAKKRIHAEKCDEAGARLSGMRDGLSVNAVTKFLTMVNPNIPNGQIALAKHELVEMVKQLEMQE